MPSEDVVVLYRRLMDTAEQLQLALTEDTDPSVFLGLLETHRQIMASLKQPGLVSDPDSLNLICQAKEKVEDLIVGISNQRDKLADQMIQRQSKKRAFDAYHNI